MDKTIIFRNEADDFYKGFFKDIAEVVDIPSREISESVDVTFTNLIKQFLEESTYDNILIPISIGRTLSDFLGLRLATHIRVTVSFNQFSNIYIYSYVGLKDLIENECFNILKTTGVRLLDFNKVAFEKAIASNEKKIETSEISNEISKLKLDIPDNYLDNHSIANEWAIYRWSTIINASNDEILSLKFKLENDLYFKYLKTIYPVFSSDTLENEKLKLEFVGNPTILYIDDEAEKGWREIFEKIMLEQNDIDFMHLDNEFNEKSKKEIVDISLKTIKEENVDVVILDFRLSTEDFEEKNIQNVTGFQILKRIKEYNKGIQVIIFSATNKIWNFQALHNAGADGFIIKEGVDIGSDSGFTKTTILNFIGAINKALKRKFLKKVFIKCKKIQDRLSLCDYVDDTPYEEFLNDLNNQLKLISISANNIDLEDSMTLDVVYLNCFNFLEKFKHYYLKLINNQFVLGIEEVEINRYSIRNGNEGVFIKNNSYDNPSWFHTLSSLYIDYFEISLNTDDIAIKNLNKIKDFRNDYIHGSKAYFSKNNLLLILEICAEITDGMKE